MYGSHVTGSERTSAYIERVWVQHSTNTNSSNSSSGWRELDTPSQKTTHAHKTPKQKSPHTCTRTFPHRPARTHINTYTQRNTRKQIHTHTCTYTHINTRTYTHINTRTYSTDSCSDGRRDHFDRLLQLGARGFFRKLSFCDAAVAVNDDGVRLLIHQGGVKPNSKPHVGWARHLKKREQYGARQHKRQR